MKIFAINGINTKPICTNRQAFVSRLMFEQRKDVVCFKGNSLIDLPKEELYKKIIDSLNPENFIGQGTEAEVYRIKDTNYCVRIPYEVLSLYSKKTDENYLKKLFYNKDINPSQKINHTEIELSCGATVMKYIEGERPKDYIKNQEGRYKFQSKIADMPIKSYTDFLHQISNGIDNEMVYDHSTGNLIIDTKKNKFTAIDFLPISENPREIKPLNEMYSVLTSYGSEQATGKKIFENVMHAGLDEFQPGCFPCMDVELFDFVELCDKRIFDSQATSTQKLMQKISQKVRILKELKINEYTNGIFSTFIKEKIFEIKDLIKYIK